MNISIEYCQETINLFKYNNETHGQDRIYKILNNFINMYILNNNEELFREDGKKIFYILKNTWGSNEIIKESLEYYNTSTDMNDVNKIELKNYLNFTNNIDYLYNNIETAILTSKNNIFSIKCNEIIKYLNRIKLLYNN